MEILENPLFIVLGLSFGITWILTWHFIRVAHKKGVLDIPNERSSHAAPTPRGGGVAIVICTLITGVILGRDDPALLTVIGFSGLIALVGAIDDRISLSAKFRFGIQIVAAIGLIFLLDRPLLAWPLSNLNAFITASGLALFLVWMTNLYNFMDGIDGMAAIQAITVSATLGTLSQNPKLATLYFTVAGASMAFFWFNRSPAKIFMGDVGSGFLGFFFGAIAIYSSSPKLGFQLPFEVTAIVLAVFVIDATTTIIFRTMTGYDPTKPHREFGFHHFVRSGHTHRQISILYGMITLFWCVPWAIIADAQPEISLLCLLACYGPLTWIAIQFARSGQKLVSLQKSRQTLVLRPIHFAGLNVASTEAPGNRTRRVFKVRLYRAKRNLRNAIPIPVTVPSSSQSISKA